MPAMAPQPVADRHIPAGIWALGFVSPTDGHLLGDDPRAAARLNGDGTRHLDARGRHHRRDREATASIVKVFSGALSDWLGKRKFLAVLGYGLAAVTKPIFPLASSLDWLVTARFIDRVGKGKRGAPRDALVADIAPPHLRGASFGLRQSLGALWDITGPQGTFLAGASFRR